MNVLRSVFICLQWGVKGRCRSHILQCFTRSMTCWLSLLVLPVATKPKGSGHWEDPAAVWKHAMKFAIKGGNQWFKSQLYFNFQMITDLAPFQNCIYFIARGYVYKKILWPWKIKFLNGWCPWNHRSWVSQSLMVSTLVSSLGEGHLSSSGTVYTFQSYFNFVQLLMLYF